LIFLAEKFKSIIRGMRKNVGRMLRLARVFRNFFVLMKWSRVKGRGAAVLSTWDGLEIVVRKNLWDARIVEEIFVERPYVKHLLLPPNPTVVDVGAYIGDFSLYAAKYLNANVIAYEPTRENFTMLQTNVERNGLLDKIRLVNKAVGVSESLVLNTWIDGDEVHVSAYQYPKAEKRTISCESLEGILKKIPERKIDLLKLDCEGGEYDILEFASASTFDAIRHIVFEWHRIDGYEKRLYSVLERLKQAGYTVIKRANIIDAFRHQTVPRHGGQAGAI